MESWYKNVSEIPKVTFIFLNFQENFINVKKIEKIQVVSKKSINSFEIKKDRPPNYLCDNFLLTFQHYFYAKYIFLTSSIRLIF